MVEILGYHHLSLTVTDLAASVEWYRKVFDLEVVAEIEGAGFRRTRLRAGSGVTLSLTAHDGSPGGRFDERRTGVDHVAFDVGAAQGVKEAGRRFRELGVEHSPAQESSSGSVRITLRDPDNIQLEVFGTDAAR